MKTLFWAVIWLLPFTLTAQSLTSGQARADLRYLNRKLTRIHPGLGYYVPVPTYQKTLDSLLTLPMEAVTYQELYRQGTALLTTIKDGHTDIFHRKHYFSSKSRFFPFLIRQVGDSYFVAYNLSEDTTLVRGTELLTIDERPVAEIHRILQQYERGGSDGDNLTGRQARSLMSFGSYYAGWFGPSDSLTIAYRLPGDTTRRSTRLAGQTNAAMNRLMGRRYGKELGRGDRNLTVRLVDSVKHTAILRVQTFSHFKGDLLGLRYKKKLKKAFQTLKEKNVQNLIVDVRGNGGGALMNAARLLSYWMPEPYNVTQASRMKRGARQAYVKAWNPFSLLFFHWAYKRDTTGGYDFAGRPGQRKFRPQTALAFRGNIYFLMNGASYSASSTVLAKSLDAGVGTFVGEACGGAYWGSFAGQFQQITLPHSRLRVRIPLKQLRYDVDPTRANGFTIEPDFPARRTLDDLLNARDYGLIETIRLIQQNKVAERNPKRSSLASSGINPPKNQ